MATIVILALVVLWAITIASALVAWHRVDERREELGEAQKDKEFWENTVSSSKEYWINGR